MCVNFIVLIAFVYFGSFFSLRFIRSSAPSRSRALSGSVFHLLDPLAYSLVMSIYYTVRTSHSLRLAPAARSRPPRDRFRLIFSLFLLCLPACARLCDLRTSPKINRRISRCIWRTASHKALRAPFSLSQLMRNSLA